MRMQRLNVHKLSAAYFLFIFFQLCICIPSTSARQRHHKRDNDPSNSITAPPIFNFTVLSAKESSGRPPKLQTKVYIPQDPVSVSNLTNRQTMGERRIITCENENAEFHHSQCRHKSDMTGSIRKYVVWCREDPPPNVPRPTFTLPTEAQAMASAIAEDGATYSYHDSSLFAELGICDTDEVCVDSLYGLEWWAGMRLIANCVKKSMFKDAEVLNDEWDDPDDDTDAEGETFWDAETGNWVEDQEGSESDPSRDEKGGGKKQQGQVAQKPESGSKQQAKTQGLPHGLFAGRYASVVVSKDDNAQTPLRVEKLELRSLGNEDGNEIREDGDTILANQRAGIKNQTIPEITEQERNCTDCVDLKTYKPFSPDTEALEMEVKFVSAGSMALTGIIWLALFSG